MPTSSATPVPDLQQLGIHHDFIKNAVHEPVRQAPQQVLSQLPDHALDIPRWYSDAPDAQREALKEIQALNNLSLTALNTYLNQISSVEAFAKPLLTTALFTRFGIECDVDNNIISQTTLNYFTQEVTSTTTQTLLQAALHNFEDSQATPGGIPKGSHLWSHKSQGYDTSPPRLIDIPPVEFARLCRELDIGGQYQTHLTTLFNPADNTAKNLLIHTFERHERNVMMLQAQIALMKGDISASTHSMLLGYCRGDNNPVFHGLPLTCNALQMDDIPFNSMILSHGDPLERDRRCVLYIPGDPVSCIKEYASVRLAATDWLYKMQDPEYRRFFIHLAPQRQKLQLTKRLNARFIDKNNDPLEMTRNPISTNLFSYLFELKKFQLMNDARFIAVPTAEINRLSLLNRIEHYFDVGLNVLNIAALFVPGLGEVMTVVFAAQIMTDIYHGIEAWEQGDQAQAWSYTRSVLLNVAFIAAAGKLAKEFKAAPAIERSPLVEELDTVEMPDGKTQLWMPDLAPFEHDVPPHAAAKVDQRGLYTHEGNSYLELEGKQYQVQYQTNNTYRLKHPTRPNAYSPLITSNGHGAWTHEIDEIQTWEPATFVRRLDVSLQGLSDEQALNFLKVSGTDESAVRQSFIDQQPPPALLSDCIQRFKARQDLNEFITRMHAGDVQADPLSQLQVLTHPEIWPANKRLRCIDSAGNTLIEYGPVQAGKVPVIQVLDSQVRQGQLFKTVLMSLDTAEIMDLIGVDPLTGTFESDINEQVRLLGSRVAKHTEYLREDLLDVQYRQSQESDDPLIQTLTRNAPTLPLSAANEIIGAATSSEIVHLEEGRVPLRLKEEARLFEQENRLMRAYEGLYFEHAPSLDTQKLILHSLAEMPGWPKDFRLQVHEGTLSGTVIDEIGSPDASIRKALVRHGNRYITYNGENQELHGLDNLYASVLHALPDAQRAALGFPSTAQGKLLEEALLERPILTRAKARKLLNLPPQTTAPHSPLRRVKGRMGYPRLEAEGARCVRAPFACMSMHPRRIRHLTTKLFPAHSTENIQGFIGVDSLFSREGLSRLEALNKEFKALKNSLNDWQNEPLEFVQFSDEHIRPVHIRDKARFADKLIKCWQRHPESGALMHGSRLDFSNIQLGKLPTLEADFSHVTSLKMNNQYLHSSYDAFLKRFPNLKELSFESTHLRELPESLFTLQGLSTLKLHKNKLALTPAAASKLATLKNLKVLDLSHNKLEHLPDFSQMTELRSLNVSQNRLTQWPAGVDDLPFLTQLDLRGNRITTLPEGYFQLPADRLRGTFLHDNPLNARTHDSVNELRSRFGLALESRVHAPDTPHPANLWMTPDLPAADVSLKNDLWDALSAEPGSESFFKVIRDLVASADFERDRALLTDRVWQVLETAGIDSEYRASVFAHSIENETCVDRVATLFSRFGYRVLLREALLSEGAEKELKLLKLMKSEVRLIELNDIAETQIALQQEAYNAALRQAVLPASDIARLKPDPVEVKLIYQVDLAKRLELLWQPAHMKFRNVSKITPAQIEDAYQIIVNKEASPGFMANQLLELEPWKNHIEAAYKGNIKTSNALLDQRYLNLETLSEKHKAWVDAVAANNQDAVAMLEGELKELAQTLVIDESKVFTQTTAFEDLYNGELTTLANMKKKNLVQITQGILDKKPLETIKEE